MATLLFCLVTNIKLNDIFYQFIIDAIIYNIDATPCAPKRSFNQHYRFFLGEIFFESFKWCGATNFLEIVARS